MAQQLPSGASTSFRNMDFFAVLEGSFRDLSFQSPSSSSHSMLASPPNQNRLDFGLWGIPSPSPTLDRGVPLASPLGRYGMVRGTPNSSRAARMAAIDDSMGIHVVWSGTPPPRNCEQESSFSFKVFLGGVPWDITDFDLQKIFSVFGPLRVEWPGVHDRSATQRPKGHLYLIFERESSVVNLLGRCSYDFHHNQHNWFYRVASKRMMGKSAQVIPWQLGDATYSLHGYVPTPGTPYRIFVANLHGMITAEGLGRIMNDLFGGVIAATLDTDKTKYPIGSGRVTFNNPTSHLKAIRAETVEVRTAKFTRKIKIDPYLEDSMCSMCGADSGPYFCRDLNCFDYYCTVCWQMHHEQLRPQVRTMNNVSGATFSLQKFPLIFIMLIMMCSFADAQERLPMGYGLYGPQLSAPVGLNGLSNNPTSGYRGSMPPGNNWMSAVRGNPGLVSYGNNGISSPTFENGLQGIGFGGMAPPLPGPGMGPPMPGPANMNQLLRMAFAALSPPQTPQYPYPASSNSIVPVTAPALFRELQNRSILAVGTGSNASALPITAPAHPPDSSFLAPSLFPAAQGFAVSGPQSPPVQFNGIGSAPPFFLSPALPKLTDGSTLIQGTLAVKELPKTHKFSYTMKIDAEPVDLLQEKRTDERALKPGVLPDQ